MKKQSKNAKGNKVTNANNKSRNVKLTKAERRAKFEQTAYYQKVLKVNAEFKTFSHSIGGCRSLLLSSEFKGLSTFNAKVLRATKKNANNEYKRLQEYFKPNKTSGNYSVFRLLQVLNKYGKYILSGDAAELPKK